MVEAHPSSMARVTLLAGAAGVATLYALAAVDAAGVGPAWEGLAWSVAAVGTAIATAAAARAQSEADRAPALLLASVAAAWCLAQIILQATSVVTGGTTLGVAELVAVARGETSLGPLVIAIAAGIVPLLAWLILIGSNRADRRIWLVVDLAGIAGALAAIALGILGSLVDRTPPNALVAIALPSLYLAASIGGLMTMMGLDLRRDTIVPFVGVLGAPVIMTSAWLIWMTSRAPSSDLVAANALVPIGLLVLGAGAIHVRRPPSPDAARQRDLERRRAALPLTAVWVATAALATLGVPHTPWLGALQLGLTLVAVAALLIRQGLLLRERDGLLSAETAARTDADSARRQALSAMRDAQSALDQLAETEERYRSLVERIPAVVYLDRIDPKESPERDGFLGSVYFGPQAAELLGVEPERLIDDLDLWDRMIHPEDEPAAARRTREFYRTGIPLDQTYRMIRPDGEIIWINQRAELLGPDADGRYLAQGVVIDVTERQTAEERLRETAKLEAVGRLAGGIAHDFNNLLTIISGYASLLREELESDDPRRDEVAAIERAAGTAASLVTQLLAYGRRQKASRRVLDLGQVTEQALPMLTRVAGDRVEIQTTFEPDAPPIHADPAQVDQVIMNLVLNAHDAMPHGGRLEVRVARRVISDDEARSEPGLRPGAYAELTVRDTGVGMDDATRGRLFEPFFTTKPVGHGTGLGLASVYGIVRQSDGHIEVESALGAGSTFRVLFPAAGTEPHAADAGHDDPAGTTGDTIVPVGRRILLVEDEPGVRTLAATVLRRAGHEVVTAASGDEALRAIAAIPSRPDLLLTDVMMPGMTGPELAANVRVAHPDMPVLFMSGYAEDAVDEGRPLGGDGFIAKPFDPAALVEAVSAILDPAPRAAALRSSEPPAA